MLDFPDRLSIADAFVDLDTGNCSKSYKLMSTIILFKNNNPFLKTNAFKAHSL
jgi:hypothetical protein